MRKGRAMERKPEFDWLEETGFCNSGCGMHGSIMRRMMRCAAADKRSGSAWQTARLFISIPQWWPG